MNKAPVELGASGTCVRILQQSLNSVAKAGLAVDGSFGCHTRHAVYWYKVTYMANEANPRNAGYNTFNKLAWDMDHGVKVSTPPFVLAKSGCKPPSSSSGSSSSGSKSTGSGSKSTGSKSSGSGSKSTGSGSSSKAPAPSHAGGTPGLCYKPGQWVVGSDGKYHPVIDHARTNAGACWNPSVDYNKPGV
jgi:hypothetical protein